MILATSTVRIVIDVLIIIVAAGYATMKCIFTYRWWFHGRKFWSQAYHDLPETGDKAADYGYLLGTKWIGTRNLGLGVAIYGCLAFRKWDYVGMLCAMGFLVELFDGFWLALGKYKVGWSKPRTNFYMRGAFLWLPDLALAAAGFFTWR